MTDKSYEAIRSEQIAKAVAALPTDPGVLLKLIEQRYSLEYQGWDNCPEWVALKAVIAAAPSSEARQGLPLDREHIEATVIEFLSKVLTVKQITAWQNEINTLFADLTTNAAPQAKAPEPMGEREPGSASSPAGAAPASSSAARQAFTAEGFLDELVRRAKMQEGLNGEAWAAVVGWLEAHRPMVTAPTTAQEMPKSGQITDARKVILFAAGFLRGRGDSATATELTEVAQLLDDTWDDYLRLLREKQDRLIDTAASSSAIEVPISDARERINKHLTRLVEDNYIDNRHPAANAIGDILDELGIKACRAGSGGNHAK